MGDSWISAPQHVVVGECPNCHQPMYYKTRQDGTLLTPFKLIDGHRYVQPQCSCSDFNKLLRANPNTRDLAWTNITRVD